MPMKPRMQTRSKPSSGDTRPRSRERAILTECVRGKISATGRRTGGRFSRGKTTPEKKNMGDRNPVKKKLKWLIVETKEVTRRAIVANIRPVRKPTIPVRKLSGRG